MGLAELLGLKSNLQTYDFRQWQISILNQVLSGYAEDEGFTIEWTGGWFQPKVGLDGEITRNFAPNNMARLTLRLMQSSGDNGVLTLALLAGIDGDPKVNTATFSVEITSLTPSGGSYRSNDCWIEKPPTVTGGREASVMEWAFCCPNMPPLIT